MNHALRYCLDTDMCIYLLNGHPRVKARVAEVGVTALVLRFIIDVRVMLPPLGR